jgi:hypothetical protein
MQPKQILEESKKYLLFISDALQGAAQSHLIGRAEREVCAKYSADMLEYFKGLEQLKIHIESQEQAAKRLQIKADLQIRHEEHKKVLIRAEQNLRIVKQRLAEIKKSGTEKETEEAQMRVDYYTKQQAIAKQNEFIAKRDFEQGA